MKNVLFVTLLAVAATISVGSAGGPPAKENSMDAPRRGRRPPNMPNMFEAAQSPTNADVGDGDSFGRSVNYLGYAQTNGVAVWWDCTDQIPGTCVVPDPETSTGGIVKIGDEAVIRLPARAARSLLCFTINPIGFVTFQNPSGTRQNASYSMGVRWQIESDVLKDTTLIDQITGLPYNGVMNGSAPVAGERFTIEPGAFRDIDVYAPRTCNSGHVSRRSLIALGFTEAQAREFFRKPITLRFGAGLNVSWGMGGTNPGIRVYGD